MKTLIVDSNDVMIIDILDNSMGVSFLTYIILNGDEILDGNSLLAAIQVYDGKSVEKASSNVHTYLPFCRMAPISTRGTTLGL